ncbi:asparagine synthase-related protein, partial [Acinetobacter baumannii]|uniref:asparagine synthase-related protein n=2 Tax=Gammaproteobacteria TaxID=1236 RepID=UPI0013D51153
FQGRIEDAEEQLDTLLRDAVALRMVADVPVGVFLSGGTDSSLVAALMQAQSGQPVHSFSIGFTDSGHDEAPLARELAAHLGCD